jgi:TonB-linked SusC/RagA family outer membrane protein
MIEARSVPDRHRGRGRWVGVPFLLVFLLWHAVPAAAQQSVGGRVVNATTQAGLEGAQIVMAGTSRGMISSSDGRFLFLNVEGQSVTLRVVLLGYKTLEQTVQVGSTGLVLGLEPTAVDLDALVITATAGAAQARSLGNSIARVEASDIQQVAPQASVQDLLSGRVAGMAMMRGTGEVGGGMVTAIRGVGSLSLSHEPLIYVDGVRVNNNQIDATVAFAGGFGGDGPSRLNDLDPDQIESVQVIKGPAAATLYGTEASNGVIQIITKKGRTQDAQWNFRVDQGISYLPHPDKAYPTIYGNDQNGQLISLNIIDNDIATGFGDPFSTGHNQGYGANVRGGTDRFRYYLSGDWNRQEGIVSYNWQNKLNLRSNLDYVIGDKLDVGLSLGSIQEKTQAGSAEQPITTGIIWGIAALKDTPSRGYITATPEDYAKYVHGIEDLNRTIVSLQVKNHPLSWFTHRLTVGTDLGNNRATLLFDRTPVQPGPFGSSSQGDKQVENKKNTFLTVDYSATVAFDLTKSLRSETSGGAQYYRKVLDDDSTEGQVFPLPGLQTVSSGASRFASEFYSENRTFGLYVQQQFSLNNRLFVTGAVRGDDNSAFGANYNFVTYPKVSASWVASDEGFLRNVSWLNTLRFRGAWGEAGQQPDVFAAIQLYSPSVGPNGAPTVTMSNLGNPNLKPEVGKELELGFDLGVLDNRLAIDFTYYDKTTENGILQAPVKPSTGFPGYQYVNLGKFTNKGIELGLTGDVVRGANLAWSLGFQLSTNKNEIVDLGGIEVAPGGTAANQYQYVGFPLSSIFQKKVVHAEYDANGNLTNVLCDGGTGKLGLEQGGAPVSCDQAPGVYWGQPTPTWLGSVNTTLTLWKNVRLYALADFTGGNMAVNGTIGAAHIFFRNSKCINEHPICSPILAAYDGMGEWLGAATIKAGFSKLRNVSLNYTLPKGLVARFGASRGSISLSGENLATLWIAQNGTYGLHVVDPEIRKQSTLLDAYVQEQWPQFTTWTTTIRLSY